IQTNFVAESYAGRLAAVLAADADLQPWAGTAALLDADSHQPPDTHAVEHLKRIVLEDLLLEVPRDERAFGIVARVAIRGLRQVVRTEREELGDLGERAGNDARTRQLHHRSDFVVDLDAGGTDHFFGDRLCGIVGYAHLFRRSHAWNHHVGARI